MIVAPCDRGHIVTERAVRHVRKFLGQRLRALRKERGLSQERLGTRASLSGKFIGEVERGEKSISVDSLYHVAVALVSSTCNPKCAHNRSISGRSKTW